MLGVALGNKRKPIVKFNNILNIYFVTFHSVEENANIGNSASRFEVIQEKGWHLYMNATDNIPRNKSLLKFF